MKSNVFIVLFFCSNLLFAQSIVVIGYGDTKDKALKNAFQNAVEQEVGILVDTKTVVRNGKLIKNNILSFSNGFIQDYKEISSKAQMGFWTVKISAVVEHQKLLSKLKKMKINPKQIKDTKQLYAQVVSQVKTKFDAEDIFKKFYRTFTSLPIESYYVEVTDFNIDTDLATRKTVPVKVTVKLKHIKGEAAIVRERLNRAYYLMKKLSIGSYTEKDTSLIGLFTRSNPSYPNQIEVDKDGIKTYFGFPRSYSVIYPFKDDDGFGKVKRNSCSYISVLFLDKHGRILKMMKTTSMFNGMHCLSSMVSNLKIGTDLMLNVFDDHVGWDMPIKYLKKITQVKAQIIWL